VTTFLVSSRYDPSSTDGRSGSRKLARTSTAAGLRLDRPAGTDVGDTFLASFWALAVLSFAAVPLALFLRNVKLGEPAAVTH
jgi:hypothetical protein